MPEFDVPRRPYPLVLPSEGGFENAVRRGRRLRRRRAYGAAGGAMTLVVGVLSAAMYQPHKVEDKLDTDVADRPSRVERRDPPRDYPIVTGTTVPATTSPARRGGEGVVAGRPADTTAGKPASRPLLGAGKPASTKPPVVVPSTAPSSTKPQMMREWQGSSACTPVTPGAASSWCDTVFVNDPTPNGTRQLIYRLCPDSSESLSDAVLEFDSTKEADLRVTDAAGKTVWSWSKGQAFTPTAGRVEVARTACVRWYVNWNVTDEDGRRLPKGSYHLHGWSNAIGLRGRPHVSVEFSIS